MTLGPAYGLHRRKQTRLTNRAAPCRDRILLGFWCGKADRTPLISAMTFCRVTSGLNKNTRTRRTKTDKHTRFLILGAEICQLSQEHISHHPNDC